MCAFARASPSSRHGFSTASRYAEDWSVVLLGKQNDAVAMPASPEPPGLGQCHDRATGMSTLLSAPCAKKAMERPSGDQNGYEAPSVPGRVETSAYRAAAPRFGSCLMHPWP